MTSHDQANPPKVLLTRTQWVRLVIVGALVIIALARTVPDLVRVVYPLHVFGYLTDGGATIISATRGPLGPEGSEPLLRGDRVRIDRIKPADRKPGIAGGGYTYDNPYRPLPITRAGRDRVVILNARPESPTQRSLTVLRILLQLVAVAVGAMLFLLRPSIATAGFFVFCLSYEAPTTYIDLIVPNPWREVQEWLGITLRNLGGAALLLFAFCLIDGERDAERERIVAWSSGFLGLALGTLRAYADWLLTYSGHPVKAYTTAATTAAEVTTVLTILVFAFAFVRSRGTERRNTGWIVLAFAFAGACRIVSDQFFPAYIPVWLNSILLSANVVPIAVVGVAVVRRKFFNIDFVVSRGMVLVATTAAAVGIVTLIEEVGTYVFYQNTDLAYGVLIVISMFVGSSFGKVREFLHRVVDRFIFRDRHEQRVALEFIGGYILDAETREDVYRALLEDAPHALKLSFGGIMNRRPDGGYELAHSRDWPVDCVVQLEPEDELTHAINSSRNAMSFSGKESQMIARAFPHERLTFAAPLFSDRRVSAIVVYGHNISSLDLDPEERELLVRVVAHASIALAAIELAEYREAVMAAGTDPMPLSR